MYAIVSFHTCVTEGLENRLLKNAVKMQLRLSDSLLIPKTCVYRS